MIVARADRARYSIDDEIPLAHRDTGRKIPKSLLKARPFFILFLCALIVSFSIKPRAITQAFLKPFGVTNDSVSPDGRLLGHFPYPEADGEKLVLISAGIKVHTELVESFESMRAAAAAASIDLVLLSGYRSHSLQKEIFFDIKSIRNQTASERAKVSAPPGHSEHSTGYAIDVGDGASPQTHFSETFESTRAFKWMRNNAARYHFKLSFPPENEQGVTYEPWHWRFEGTANALKQFEHARKIFK